MKDSTVDIKLKAEFNTPVPSKVNSFANWVMDYVPEPIKNVANEKLTSIKSVISNLYKRYRKPIEFKLTQSTLKNVTKQFSAEGVEGADALSYMKSVKNNVFKILNDNKGSKIYIVLHCVMESTDIKDGETITAVVPFSSNSEFVLESTNLNDFYETATNKILESIAAFQRQISNFRFVSVERIEINIIEYKPIRGRSYIPLTKELKSKKAIINMKNKDNECVKVDKDLKEQAKKLNWEKIEFPVSLNQISLFEKNNQDISVSVFGYENLSVYPLHISKNKNRQHQIDLLLISNGKTNHYCLINNLSRLLSSQISEHNGKKHFCKNCLQSFSTEESFSKHRLYCDSVNSIRIEIPEPNTMIEFTNYNRSMKVPFVIYADFESFIKPIDTCTPNPDESYTKQYQKHTPSSFCYYIKCFDEKIYQSKLVTFTANKNNFDNAKICHICEKDLNEDRVRDHCHITGKYRGAAHNKCNLNYKIPTFIPVFFHNLSGYDSHLFIKKLSEGGKINCIPNNEEKYISFSKELKVNEFTNKGGKKVEVKLQLRFLDSFKFMAASLDSLTKNLSKDQSDAFENFRDVCFNNYKLDPASYYTSPGLARDAALLITKVKLELLSDYDMILMIKEGIRGGINANNLYGWAMSKPLPTHGFEWMSKEDLKNWKSTS
ncbi:uncharacterized protein LOC136094149 [Hydra vulgaris]|uniref:uncharacterized protein LOC136094149 n=1 Tax=Hydra vulgaris TaxID=6087 RepID=UPI0032EA4F75